MSVLELIDSGEIIVIISYLGPLVPDTYKGHRNELLRLAKLGAEAEKASRECLNFKSKLFPMCCEGKKYPRYAGETECDLLPICKMVREGQDATKY